MKRTLALAVLGLAWSCGDGPPQRATPPALDGADFDRDGFNAVGAGGDDCVDGDPLVHPGGAERCNGIDDDCEGGPDDPFECVAGADGPCGAAPGFQRRCGDDCTWGDCRPVMAGAPCRETSECLLGDRIPCATSCGEGTRACTAGCVYGPCEPPRERCNGVDDDCDGAIDEETFGISGPARALPWAGDWIYAIAAAATDDGFAFAYGQDSFAYRIGTDWLVVLAWTDLAGAQQGEPVRLDSPEDPGVGSIDVVWTGTEVAAAWKTSAYLTSETGGTTYVAFAGREGVRVRTAISSSNRFYDVPRMAWTGESVVVVQGRQMAVIGTDGTVLADLVPLPEEAVAQTGRAYAIDWDDGLTIPGDGALLWVDLDGSVLQRVPLDVTADAAVVVDAEGISVGAPHVLIRLDHDGLELWRAETQEPNSWSSVEKVGDELWAVLERDNGGMDVLKGWRISAEGATVDPPRRWSDRNAASTVASNGDVAWIALTRGPAFIAPLGCASP